MLIKRNFRGDVPFRTFVMFNTNLKNFAEFLNVLKSEFSRDELYCHLCEELSETLGNSFYFVFSRNGPDCIQIYWQFLTEILKPEKLKQILLASCRLGNCFQESARSRSADVFKKVLEIYKNTLSVSEITTLLRSSAKLNENIFHILAYNDFFKGF